ncbi:hypothetical protein COLO4_36705 [Corchorus olitorius]|uniref:Uncharacterized protein n=1 Tax=Corchorus olitorius TaxID=93759 RepID=A0A1R3G645_9ROSI|nr:hypothetical protein COLO4_36705 [Corchorus olitorius]
MSMLPTGDVGMQDLKNFMLAIKATKRQADLTKFACPLTFLSFDLLD